MTTDFGTIWESEEEFNATSREEKLLRVVREQLIPNEAENRVKAANGKAPKYYVYGTPKTGGRIIAKGPDGINTVANRILLGTFGSEEEARAFQRAVNSKIEKAAQEAQNG